MAKQANGAVLVRYGETVVLVTATASDEPREGVDFFPLTVDYEEKMYAVGKIPGGFIKREGRPGESAILCSRLIDRPIRPLFPEGYRNDVQIVATVMSVEHDNAPEIAAMIGASCALTISDIPFLGPIAGVRVGRIDGQFVINPTVEQREVSDLNLTIAGSRDAVMMVEAGANELPEEVILEAILFGHEEIKKIVAFQDEIQKACGKEKREVKLFAVPEELEKAIREYATDKLDQAVRNPDKLARDEDISNVKAEAMEHFLELYPDAIKEIPAFLAIVKHTDIGKTGSFECIHDHLLKKNRIFCNNYRRFINCTIAHFFDFRNLNRSFRRNFCNNFLKIENGNKLIIALRDTGCYAVIAGT
jgi:polyribonucleotide nucleotidyltransferase